MNKEVIGVELSKLKTVDVCKAELDIPNRTGIYFWLDKNSHEVVYIGVGAGRNGLRNRIVRQHLNPKYIEYRAHKQSAKDHFQLSVPVRKIVKGKMANGIDQSAFRKKHWPLVTN